MKKLILKIILFFLYKGIKVLYKRDSEITDEINSLPNNYVVKISTNLTKKTYICFSINNGKIKRLKKSEKYDLEIVFKNTKLAFNVFSGKVSISDAYSMHYFQLFGNIYESMKVTRIMERVEGYLFPKFICNKILKKPFNREISIFKTYLLCIFRR